MNEQSESMLLAYIQAGSSGILVVIALLFLFGATDVQTFAAAVWAVGAGYILHRLWDPNPR